MAQQTDPSPSKELPNVSLQSKHIWLNLHPHCRYHDTRMARLSLALLCSFVFFWLSLFFAVVVTCLSVFLYSVFWRFCARASSFYVFFWGGDFCLLKNSWMGITSKQELALGTWVPSFVQYWPPLARELSLGELPGWKSLRVTFVIAGPSTTVGFSDSQTPCRSHSSSMAMIGGATVSSGSPSSSSLFNEISVGWASKSQRRQKHGYSMDKVWFL